MTYLDSILLVSGKVGQRSSQDAIIEQFE